MNTQLGRVNRRSLLGGAFGTLLLAACGDDGNDESAGTSATSTATAVATTPPASYRLLPLSPGELGAPSVPAPTLSTASSAVTLAQAIAPYEGYGSTAAPGVFPRTVRHGRGESVLNTKPQRVVALERGSIDILFELGIKPVAVVNPGTLAFTADLDAFLSGVPRVGTAAEPDFEAIVAAQPDLIFIPVGDDTRDQRLSQIAPTIFRTGSGVVWKQVFALTTTALGEEAKGATVVQRYEERVRRINAALPTPRPSFSIIRVLNNNLRYMLRSNYAGLILTDLGIPRPEPQNVDDFALSNMSVETLGQYGNADIIVLASDDGQAAADFTRQMTESPLWQTLDAVRNGKVMVVDNSTWIGGVGYGAANRVLDDIAKQFNISA